MGIWEVLVLALALSMDAFAVAVGSGCAISVLTFGHYVRMGTAFGFFQCIMPVVGWMMGTTVRGTIEAWDHWVAFALLACIGVSMFREAFTEPDEDTCAIDPSRGRRLVVLSMATSLDALAVGLSFALLDVPVWGAAATIGVVCAALTCGGLFLGKRLAQATNLGRRAEMVGGCVLLAIGIKILVDHGALG